MRIRGTLLAIVCCLGACVSADSDISGSLADKPELAPDATRSEVFAMVMWDESDWRDVSVDTLPQSAHPYGNNTNASWTLTAGECAQAVRVTFSMIGLEYGYDTLILRDGDGNEVQRITGNRTSFTSDAIPGRVAQIELVTDYSIRRWGFRVSGLEEVGRCDEPTDVCATTLCVAGTHCEVQDVVCITTPCPPQPVCVPDVTNPCATVRCASGTHCEVQQVWCIRAPCPELAACVPDDTGCQPDDCGPPLGLANRICPDGVNVDGPTGNCIETEAGTCGWEIAECPDEPECTFEDCGPAPLLPALLCSDGTTGGSTGRCIPQDGGACAWEILECPDPCDGVECGDGQRCTPQTDGCDDGADACRTAGACVAADYCESAEQCDSLGLPHILCVGSFSCEANQCRYHCDTTPLEQWERVDLSFGLNDYNNNVLRGWRVEVPDGALGVRVRFENFSLEEGYDFVTLYDGAWNPIHEYTGHLGTFVSDMVPGSVVRVVLRSDYSVTDDGFWVTGVDYQL